MSGSVNSGDYGTVSVSLIVGDAKAAIAFYKEVFGAEHLYSLTMPGGGVAHAEFKIGNTIVMITDENPAMEQQKPARSGRLTGKAQRHG